MLFTSLCTTCRLLSVDPNRLLCVVTVQNPSIINTAAARTSVPEHETAAAAGGHGGVVTSDSTTSYSAVAATTSTAGEIFEYEFAVTVKYVRREIRALTDRDRETFFNAVSVLQRVPSAVGRAVYGDKYYSKDYFNRMHLYYGEEIVHVPNEEGDDAKCTIVAVKFPGYHLAEEKVLKSRRWCKGANVRMKLTEAFNGGAHGNIHGLLGGTWSPEADEYAAVTPYIVIPFVHHAYIAQKIMWRENAIECPESCTFDQGWKDCQCQCSESLMEGRTAAEASTASRVAFLSA
ncbi:unnamed protein product [Ectocarpus sp. CCAP 1310/34]|nr:unnamed protein product [Ectocarpus sp. CCAP 1310/34]